MTLHTLFQLVVFVHVAAATLLVGGSAMARPGVRAAARRASSVAQLQAYLAIGKPLALIVPVAAILVLASGVYLTSVGHWWGAGWVQVATALWLVNTIVSGGVESPAMARLSAALADAGDGPVSERLDQLRWSPRWTFSGDLLAANDSAMVYVMVLKPTLTGSLITVVVFNGLVLAARLARRRLGPFGAQASGSPPPAAAKVD